jgi:hypothetical protein
MLPLEGTLLEKLRKIEALHAGTTVDGEREAAHRAAERIRAWISELRGREEDVEPHYRLHDPWKRTLFVAMCRRYGLAPYRDIGRHRSTIQVHAPRTFHDQTLWPDYRALTSPARCESIRSRLHIQAARRRGARDQADQRFLMLKGAPAPVLGDARLGGVRSCSTCSSRAACG